MIDGKGMVEHAHEIQCMMKGLELLKIIVPNEFVVGGIITKLPLLLRDLATTLKHKRTHMSISDLNASLDVEEKARAKDGLSKRVEGQIRANMVHQRQSHGKGKGKQNKNNNKPKQTTTFKRRRIKMRMRVASCAVPLIIGQRSAQITKEENINLSRRL
jgi:hypothetical protein